MDEQRAKALQENINNWQSTVDSLEKLSKITPQTQARIDGIKSGILRDKAELEVIQSLAETNTASYEVLAAQEKIEQIKQGQAQQTIEELVKDTDPGTAIEKLTQVVETGGISKAEEVTEDGV